MARGRADGAGVAQLVFWTEIDRQRVHLRLSKHQREFAAELGHRVFQLVRRHRRHRVDGEPQRSHVARARLLLLDQRAIHHRQAEDERQALGLDEVEQAVGVETFQDVDRRADRDRRRGEGVQLRGMEQRHQRRHTILRVEARVDRDAERFEIDREVAADHAFRRRGRAAGIEIGNGIAIFDVSFGLLGRRRGDERIETMHAPSRDFSARRGADDDDVGDRRRVFETGLQLLDQCALDNRNLHPRMREHVAELLVAPEQIDRHADDAKLGASVIDREEFDIVGRHQRERVAALTTECEERLGRTVGEGVELSISKPAFAVHDRKIVRRTRRAARQHVADIHPHDEVAFRHTIHGDVLRNFRLFLRLSDPRAMQPLRLPPG